MGDLTDAADRLLDPLADHRAMRHRG